MVPGTLARFSDGQVDFLSVLGDVKGDAVFTYGLRKNPRLFGFSKQTGWAEGA